MQDLDSQLPDVTAEGCLSAEALLPADQLSADSFAAASQLDDTDGEPLRSTDQLPEGAFGAVQSVCC